MQKTPKFKTVEKMTFVLRGTFGRFNTQKSYPVHYILTSLAIENLDHLTTASELFPIDSIRFEELIQRDIDAGRVQTIANEYLAKSENKVVFFPPLLACLVVLDDEGRIKKQFESHVEEIEEIDQDNSILKSTWDSNAFEVSLSVADSDDTDRRYPRKDGSFTPYFEFGAQLRTNPKKVKLVVLDGQHRLAALRRIREGSNSHILDQIEIPICLMFSPTADQNVSQQDMVYDFRELFVRVNVEQKKVSGHFIILLQDDSFSAIAVRELADFLKQKDESGFSPLHLLEWNQRSDELTKKRTRNSSLTTIGIIYDVLQLHFFNAGIASSILELATPVISNDDEEFQLSEITDKIFGNEVADSVVKDKIKNILVPSLNILFRTPSPYKSLEDSVRSAFSRLSHSERDNHPSFSSLKNDYISKYIYRLEEIHEDRVKACLQDFQSWIQSNEVDNIYLLHAFQQGLVRSWISISTILGRFGVNSVIVADALVKGFEILILSTNRNYLGSSRLYTRKVLWKNERVNFSANWSRAAWHQILLIALLHKDTRIKILDVLKEQPNFNHEQCTDVDDALFQLAKSQLEDYIDRLNEELFKDTKANLVDIVSSEVFISLQSKHLSKEVSDKKIFDQEIRKISDNRVDEATTELANILQVDKSIIMR
jgi:regulator of replication initiation timing